MLIELGTITLLSAAYFGFIEIRAKKKIKKMEETISFVSTDLKTGNVYSDAALLTGSATGMSIFHFYQQLDNHEGVLQTIEERYPNEMGDASPLEWYQKVEELFSNGDRSVHTYISGYAGQQGEKYALQHLQEQGLDAELYSSKTHPNDDIFVLNHDGTITDYSVKSYGSVSDFNSIVKNHPESDHYIINQDLYEKLEDKGLIEEYAQKGISIENGGWIHSDLREEANDALFDLHDAGDLVDDIPYVGLVMLGVKGVKNINEYRSGNQSGNELAVNVAGDATRIGAAAGGGMLGAKAGAGIGTLIAPGIGTAIGGVLGSLVGAVGSGKAINKVKNDIKWGGITRAQEEVGNQYISGFSQSMKHNWMNSIFNYDDVQVHFSKERKLANNFEKQWNPYRSSTFSISAVLSHFHTESLKRYTERIQESINESEKKIIQICEQAAENVNGKSSDKEFQVLKRRFLGEIILGNEKMLFTNDEFPIAKHFQTYRNQVMKYPNYPYRFSESPNDIITKLTLRELKKTKETSFEKPWDRYLTKKYKWYMLSSLLFSIGIFSVYLYSYFL
jgi:hypothetical protein